MENLRHGLLAGQGTSYSLAGTGSVAGSTSVTTTSSSSSSGGSSGTNSGTSVANMSVSSQTGVNSAQQRLMLRLVMFRLRVQSGAIQNS